MVSAKSKRKKGKEGKGRKEERKEGTKEGTNEVAAKKRYKEELNGKTEI
jgi:hypothetical protein